MPLRNIMTSRVVTVDMDDRLSVVKDIFDAMKFHHLLRAKRIRGCKFFQQDFNRPDHIFFACPFFPIRCQLFDTSGKIFQTVTQIIRILGFFAAMNGVCLHHQKICH